MKKIKMKATTKDIKVLDFDGETVETITFKAEKPILVKGEREYIFELTYDKN